MKNYAGIDVSLELSSVCVVDAQGKIQKEAKVATAYERSGFSADYFMNDDPIGRLTSTRTEPCMVRVAPRLIRRFQEQLHSIRSSSSTANEGSFVVIGVFENELPSLISITDENFYEIAHQSPRFQRLYNDLLGLLEMPGHFEAVPRQMGRSRA